MLDETDILFSLSVSCLWTSCVLPRSELSRWNDHSVSCFWFQWISQIHFFRYYIGVWWNLYSWQYLNQTHSQLRLMEIIFTSYTIAISIFYLWVCYFSVQFWQPKADSNNNSDVPKRFMEHCCSLITVVKILKLSTNLNPKWLHCQHSVLNYCRLVTLVFVLVCVVLMYTCTCHLFRMRQYFVVLHFPIHCTLCLCCKYSYLKVFSHSFAT